MLQLLIMEKAKNVVCNTFYLALDTCVNQKVTVPSS